MGEQTTSTAEQADQKLGSLIPKEILDVFRSSYSKFTKVQVHAGLKMLAHEDVVVESPTGSGKTLAFLLPALTIMKRRPKWEKGEIGLLVICPSRDLAVQIVDVARPFVDAIGFSIHSTIGGKSVDTDLKKIHDGVNVLIATPGRLERLIEGDKKEGKLRRMLKTVEVLIVDEADKFIESSFVASMKTILECLPKQRRTGLFSATQAKDKLDLAPFTLRTPSFIKLADKKDVVSPSSLSVFFTQVRADDKLMALVEFIRSVPEKKVLVFFSSCHCVQYFSRILPSVLSKRKVFAVHGRNKKSRPKFLAKFRKTKASVMLSTDLMARGIDIPDLDWVVHFDIPKKSSWLVHRSGRAGRNGREGSALLLLTPEQAAYSNFIHQHEKLMMKEMRVKTVTELKSEQLRQRIVEMASKDREILEHGTAAFISWIKAQTQNDAFIVCSVKELDIIGHAHAYGLLRLPKIKEILTRDSSRFKRSNIDTSSIPYKTKDAEKKRKDAKEKKRDVYKIKESGDQKAQIRKNIRVKKEEQLKKREANAKKIPQQKAAEKATGELNEENKRPASTSMYGKPAYKRKKLY